MIMHQLTLGRHDKNKQANGKTYLQQIQQEWASCTQYNFVGRKTASTGGQCTIDQITVASQ